MKQPIDYNTLKKAILDCPDSETQAIIAFQYVLACRLGELFPYHHKPYHFDPMDDELPLAQKHKIFEPENEYWTNGLSFGSFNEYPDFWEIHVPNFKQRGDEPHFKSGIISKGKEQWLEDICLGWRRQREGQPSFFSIGHEMARKRVKDYLALLGRDELAGKTFSSHNLRDSRADHLLKLFGLNIIDVKDVLGHSSLQTTNEYLGSSKEERAKKQKREDEIEFK